VINRMMDTCNLNHVCIYRGADGGVTVRAAVAHEVLRVAAVCPV